MCVNGLGHMTQMATMAISSKIPLNIFYSRSRRPTILKLGMKHQAEEQAYCVTVTQQIHNCTMLNI